MRNTAQLFCMVRCISTRISPVLRGPLAWRTASSRAIASSPAPFGSGACDWPGRTSSAARCAAARPNTTRSSSELEPEPVGAVHRDAGRLADRHQPGDDRVGIAVGRAQHLAVIVGRDAAHVVVHGRQDRDRLARDVDAGEDLRGLGDAGQALVHDLRVEMLEVQLDVVLVRAAAAAFADLDRHRAADDVARGEVLGVRRVALHEALALAVGE